MRGIVRVSAMARPARPVAEREAVRAAVAAMRAGLSIRARCDQLARQVVSEALRAEQAEDAELALITLRAAVAPDPVLALALGADTDVAGEFRRERLARYEARDCREIGAAGWQVETREIGAAVADRLARRFRAHCRNWT